MDYTIRFRKCRTPALLWHRLYSPHDKVYNFSKIIIKQIISVEDWGMSTMKERQISLNNTRMNFMYWDHIQAFDKVLYYNNDKHKHTWFIKEWTKVSPDLNKLYHTNNICWLEKIDKIYFFIEFSIPWIHKWTPEVGVIEENIPCFYKTYYNNFWDKLMKQDPKTKQLIGQELLDIISDRVNEYHKIPKKEIINDNTVRHIARRISFQEGDKEIMINDYLEKVKRNFLQTITQVDKSDTSMRSETSNDDIAGESQQAEWIIFFPPLKYRMRKISYNRCKPWKRNMAQKGHKYRDEIEIRLSPRNRRCIVRPTYQTQFRAKNHGSSNEVTKTKPIKVVLNPTVPQSQNQVEKPY
ncbi:hypothetical protein H5410_060978 [Solanum commersonii]|uniref:Uncharacterized protein n=1 Tax=Solanum commersonii TaxID=4109 RepID=A0A9J5W7L5_SOLCO|nr:hypothetical protein H5410_060978 [Solanum commersonii]